MYPVRCTVYAKPQLKFKNSKENVRVSQQNINEKLRRTGLVHARIRKLYLPLALAWQSHLERAGEETRKHHPTAASAYTADTKQHSFAA